MKQVSIYQMINKGLFAKKATIFALLTLSLVGCDSIPFINNTSDYKGASRSRPLEVPPDLTASPSSDTYSIPGSTNYSTYSQAQEGQVVGVEKILASPESVRLEKSGAQRWLVVNAPAEKIWPVIRDFWNEMGFAVRVENAQLGFMETEWIDTDAIKKDESGSVGDKFDKWLDKLSGVAADKKKFRTRIERGTQENTTEIYMTHRAVNGAPDDGKNRVKTNLGEIETGYKAGPTKPAEATAVDAELDAELLRRLMVKLGVEEQKSKTILAQTTTLKRAEVIKETDGSATLILNDPFDRAWRRVGLALDRIGFVIEDKDRSNGVFFVRYADVDIDDTPKKKKGLIDTLKFWGDDKKAEDAPVQKEEKSMVESLKFWGSDDKKKVNPEKQYRVKVTDGDHANSTVSVVDKDNNRVRTTTANRIIALMYEQLK